MNLENLKNEFEIVGKLVDKDLEVLESNAGNTYIKGYLTIEVVEGDKVHNHKVSVFAMQFFKSGKENKSFLSAEVAMNEYVPNLDYIVARGSIGINQYYKEENLVSFNSLNGGYFSRIKKLDENGKLPEDSQKAVAKVSAIIEKTVEFEDGEYAGQIKGFSVDFFGNIIPLAKLVYTSKAESFVDKYLSDLPVVQEFKIKLNNYALIEEVESEVDNTDEFWFEDGEDTMTNNKVVKKYVNNFTMRGASGLPKVIEEEEDFAKIKELKQNHLTKLAELKGDSETTFAIKKVEKVEYDFDNADLDEDLPF